MSTQQHYNYFRDMENYSNQLARTAKIAIEESLQVHEGEKIIIVTNPDPDVNSISRALYDAALDVKAHPTLIYQPPKTQLDFAEETVIAAFFAKPEVFISMSAEKLGKDKQGIANPYTYGGKQYDHIFHLQLYGEKTCRSFWSPGTTIESFIRTVPIDYSELKRQCAAIKEILDKAVSVRITAPGGTDIFVGLQGRSAKTDDGDFSLPGSGGNLPAGETFISPENTTSEGIIVFDGSISLYDGDILIHTPIRCTVHGGYITTINGGQEAVALQKTIALAEQNAYEYEKTGKLPSGSGAIYAKNARNLGELGIGLNPEAIITGNMLEDEKAFHTCHFAIGHNYDEDAPSLIHLDGLVKDPTIVAKTIDGNLVVIEKEGMLIELPQK
jgi:leucyl aminopeptidase (aminopeptidase T)